MQRYAERTIFFSGIGMQRELFSGIALHVFFISSSFFISISDMGAIKQILFSFLLVFVGEIKIP